MACNNLGLVLAERGQYDRAIVLYRKALKIKPDHAKARINLVDALYRVGRANEAAVEFQKAMHTDPEPADVRYSLGLILYEQGRIAEAIAQWEELIRLQPEDVPALNQACLGAGKQSDGVGSGRRGGRGIGRRPTQRRLGRQPSCPNQALPSRHSVSRNPTAAGTHIVTTMGE
jgi:tetratricopeptide (TPR) repeat protein